MTMTKKKEGTSIRQSITKEKNLNFQPDRGYSNQKAKFTEVKNVALVEIKASTGSVFPFFPPFLNFHNLFPSSFPFLIFARTLIILSLLFPQTFQINFFT